MLENIQFQLLLATFAGWVGRQQSAVISYLIEENRVLVLVHRFHSALQALELHSNKDVMM